MTTEKLAIDGGAPVRTKPFGARHFFGDPEKEQLMEVMDKDPTLWTSKYKTQEFEDGFAKRHGLKYAVATDSGTGSLHAAVAAINPEPGDEIITAPATGYRVRPGHHSPERHPHLQRLAARRLLQPGRGRHGKPNHGAHQGHHGYPPVRVPGGHGRHYGCSA